ncbi:ketopantoate reductase family protein [Desulfobulbus alkaliphilus]|uniref:ketopantoate reductase family protein n=1 Tax=Desulfobulbus alkaliphilus TaxID=869814 RepID=UPI001964CE5E|nr:2-dehydropantoate 2-reductase [Desulfobulbus alkaliphilus]MBM9537302.1 2-dehydropantoate 2-reductase [Desulfobulbus alkaliphilus]
MDIVIIGAGAMGGLFGALLAPWARVTLCTTNTEHAAIISRQGLTLTSMKGTICRQRVRIVVDPDPEAIAADLVLVCTKARATATAARTALSVLRTNGLVLTLQNGLGNLERIASVVGTSKATAGITSQAATLVAPGHIRHAGDGPTRLAAGPGQSERVEAVAALFNRAGIATTVSDDVDSLLWSKLMVNVGINGLAALLRVPNGTLARVPECGQLMVQAVEEAVAVARALGIDLPYEEQVDRVRQVCVQTAENRASMLQDILKGKATEIDVINGAIVARGEEAGVATPVNLLITQLIKALEATVDQRIRGDGDGNHVHAPVQRNHFGGRTFFQENPCNRKN